MSLGRVRIRSPIAWAGGGQPACHHRRLFNQVSRQIDAGGGKNVAARSVRGTMTEPQSQPVGAGPATAWAGTSIRPTPWVRAILLDHFLRPYGLPVRDRIDPETKNLPDRDHQPLHPDGKGNT